MVFTKETLKEELRRMGVEFHPSLGEKKLAVLLANKLRERGETEIHPDLLAMAGEAQTPPGGAGENKPSAEGKKIVTMLCTVKHNGVYYKHTESHELDEASADEFIKKGYAK